MASSGSNGIMANPNIATTMSRNASHDIPTKVDFLFTVRLQRQQRILQPFRAFQRSRKVTAEDKPIPSTKDRQRVIAEYSKTCSVQAENYLTRHRGLDRAILQDSRFERVIRVDSKKNIFFPHFDREGLSGFEIKNVNFTGFASGGQKGLWYTSHLREAVQVLIVESAIDALSHAQLYGGQWAYVSLGGAISDHQRELLKGLITKAHARGATVGVGTDNDDQGEIYWKLLLGLGADFRQLPRNGKDWNDDLNKAFLIVS